jgi:hypothetical protein
MKCSTIKIQPNADGDGWEYFYYTHRNDYAFFTNVEPNANGFFHYPEDYGDEKAFNELKACMIERHKDEIDKLEKSLKHLEELEYENK